MPMLICFLYYSVTWNRGWNASCCRFCHSVHAGIPSTSPQYYHHYHYCSVSSTSTTSKPTRVSINRKAA